MAQGCGIAHLKSPALSARDDFKVTRCPAINWECVFYMGRAEVSCKASKHLEVATSHHGDPWLFWARGQGATAPSATCSVTGEPCAVEAAQGTQLDVAQ